MFISTIIIIIALYLYVVTVLALVLNKKVDEAKTVSKYVMELFIEITYELGKMAFFGAIVGYFIIPESKDLTKAFIFGTIFYIVGFFLDRIYGKGKK